MFASIFILCTSAAMFVYWFRYTCLLILSTKTSTDFAGAVAMANQLSFLDVQAELQVDCAMRLSELEASLHRDYAVVSNLLERTIGTDDDGGSLEQAMLRIDFYAMKVLLRVAGPVSEPSARKALQEMTQIVSHLANSLGERNLAGSQAS